MHQHANVCAGSSPLARGTPANKRLVIASYGLIPARAGNTRSRRRSLVCRWAHPRSRGEHNEIAHHEPKPLGSSPLARGTPSRHACSRDSRGLIPARAGNTSEVQAVPEIVRAHPRSRGEHSISLIFSSSARGSSPLARGTPNHRENTGGLSGLIPARAGNTAAVRRSLSRAWAHPRSRGEHSISLIFSSSARGSSPLARGTH